ncbi:MAG TPA: GNAT family N-acetyltransferase [Candidatus Acidoferrales bacterium]|nr:GNAT family N-acetyltransferase [Candidatus Acidoferrales bacterium]
MATEVEKGQEAEIRLGTTADRGELLAMYQGFEPKAASLGLPPHSQLEQWIAGLAPFLNFLAYADGKLVGHAVLCPEGDAGEVAVFVHQDFRGRGIGRRLLATLLEQARRMGLRKAWGMTEPDNLPLLRLVRTLGFVQDRQKDPYLFSLNLDVADEQAMAGLSKPGEAILPPLAGSDC